MSIILEHPIFLFYLKKYIFYFLKGSKGNLNGAVGSSSQAKNRPRIPTPDVTKEGMEKENRFNLSPVTSPLATSSAMPTSNVAAGIALAARKLATEPSVYPTILGEDMQPLATLQLSPIKELDSGSVNNTLQAGSPTTIELAKAILPNSLHSTTFGTITTTSIMPHSPSLTHITVFPTLNSNTNPTVSITTVNLSATPTPSQPNAIITELSSSGIDEVDGTNKQTLSRQSSIQQSSSCLTIDKDIVTPTTSSVPSNSSTMSKTKSEPKTGEVYV